LLQIPFTLEGVVACIDTRSPTLKELNNTAVHVELTSHGGLMFNAGIADVEILSLSAPMASATSLS
jgi:hypothetical protein